MNPENNKILQTLNDINTTVDISGQIAWGWYMLLSLALIILPLLAILLYKQYKKRKIKQNFTTELNKLANISDKDFLAKIAILLRRFTQYITPKEPIKTLSQQQFVAFLDNKIPLDKDLKNALEYNIYQKSVDFDRELLINYCHKWLKYV